MQQETPTPRPAATPMPLRSRALAVMKAPSRALSAAAVIAASVAVCVAAAALWLAATPTVPTAVVDEEVQIPPAQLQQPETRQEPVQAPATAEGTQLESADAAEVAPAHFTRMVEARAEALLRSERASNDEAWRETIAGWRKRSQQAWQTYAAAARKRSAEWLGEIAYPIPELSDEALFRVALELRTERGRDHMQFFTQLIAMGLGEWQHVANVESVTLATALTNAYGPDGIGGRVWRIAEGIE